MAKFLFLTKISIFDQNFYFWPKFLFLTKISIFDQNFYFWPKFLFLTEIFIFDQNFYICQKFYIFIEFSAIGTKFLFGGKIYTVPTTRSLQTRSFYNFWGNFPTLSTKNTITLENYSDRYGFFDNMNRNDLVICTVLLVKIWFFLEVFWFAEKTFDQHF